MTEPVSTAQLSFRVLHGLATDEERADLAGRLAATPEERRDFLEQARLHSLLAQAARAGAFADDQARFFQKLEEAPEAARPRRRMVWLPLAAALVVLLGLAALFLPQRASAALDRVRAALDHPVDRAYRLTVLPGRAPQPRPPRDDRGRFPPEASLDGATLWLRDGDHFVLRQTLPNGVERTFGSDGRTSWSLRSNGPVRVSEDSKRFGGGLMTRLRENAFIDLRGRLDEWKQFYDVRWIASPTPTPLRILSGRRRPGHQGGPREIEMWFDPSTNLIHRMVLRGLPQDQGGPDSVALDLVPTDPLPANFFQHDAHHEPGRPVVPEDPATP